MNEVNHHELSDGTVRKVSGDTVITFKPGTNTSCSSYTIQGPRRTKTITAARMSSGAFSAMTAESLTR